MKRKKEYKSRSYKKTQQYKCTCNFCGKKFSGNTSLSRFCNYCKQSERYKIGSNIDFSLLLEKG